MKPDWTLSSEYHTLYHLNITNSVIYVSQKLSTKYRVAQSHRMSFFIGHFPQKSPIISCSFAKNDLKLKASCGFSPPCIPDCIIRISQIFSKFTNSIIQTSRTLPSEYHKLYHLEITNYELYHLNTTNIQQIHKFYLLDITNSTIRVSQTLPFKYYELRTLSSEYHKLYHLNITNPIMWVRRTLSSKYHKLYNFNITRSII